MNRKWYLWAGAGVFGIIVMVTLALPLLFQQQVVKRIQALSKENHLHYKSLITHTFPASIEFRELSLTIPIDDSHTSDSIKIVAPLLQITGIQILPMVTNNTLRIESILGSNGSLILDTKMFSKRSLQYLKKQLAALPLKGLQAKRLQFDNWHILQKKNNSVDTLGVVSAGISGLRWAHGSIPDPATIMTACYLNAERIRIPLCSSGIEINIAKLRASGTSRWVLTDADVSSMAMANRCHGVQKRNNQEYKIHVSKMVFDQVKWKGGLASAIYIRTIQIPYAHIEMHRRQKASNLLTKDRFEALANVIPAPFQIGKISIASLFLDDAGGGGSIQCKDASVQLDDLAAFTSLPPGREKIRIGALNLRIPEIKFFEKNGLYTFHLKDLQADSKMGRLTLKEAHIVPLAGKFEFSRKLGHQADRIEALVKGIALHQFRFDRLLGNQVMAAAWEIEQVHAYLFRDRRLPRLSTRTPLPVEMFKGLPVDIHIKKLAIGSSDISYEEMPRKGGQTGILKTFISQLTISPFINHPRQGEPHTMLLRMTGSLMNHSAVNTEMEMPLAGGEYKVQGAIKNLELTQLNSGAENLGDLRIRSGLLDSLGFQFTFDDLHSQGHIIGVYHHLVLQQLKEKNGVKKIAFFRSFMLRHLIIPLNKDATLPQRKRTGRIYYVRDPSRNLSFFLLQSLLTGIKSSFSLGFLLPK